MKKQNGITLISLIITIISMLILAGVALSMVIGEGSVIEQASTAQKETENSQDYEELQLSVQSYIIDKATGNSDLVNTLKKQYDDTQIKENSDGSVRVTMDNGVRYKVFKDGTIIRSYGYTADEIYDENGKVESDENYNETKLHVGDFVEYDAGTWTADEISNIKVGPISAPVPVESGNLQDASTKPHYGFSRISANVSRNTHQQIDSSSGAGSNGWRVFSIDESNGRLTLISAGAPEAFYYQMYEGGEGYVAEYMMSGNKNASAPSNLNSENYTVRKYDMYVNRSQGAISAKPLTEDLLAKWFIDISKIEETDYGYGSDANKAFADLIGTKYGSLICTPESYYLVESYNKDFIYTYNSGNNNLDTATWTDRGVRILVELESSTELSGEPIRTTTAIDCEGNSKEYNVWKIY